jgi:hypothetical protein
MANNGAPDALAGSVLGAAVGLVTGVLLAIVGGALTIFFTFTTRDDAWWARVLIQPPALWLILGALSGAAIGFVVARRRRHSRLPLRPDSA